MVARRLSLARTAALTSTLSARSATWLRSAHGKMPSAAVFLCIGCLESRLRRELTPDDFSHAFINQGAYGSSPRLRARLTGKAFLHTNRLPQARALRNFIDQLGIVVKVRSDQRAHPAA